MKIFPKKRLPSSFKMPKLMMKRRTLITSPLAWQMTADAVTPPMIPVIAERGGTQFQAPRPVLLVDTREQNPLDFSRFDGWFAGIEKKALKLGDYSIAGMKKMCGVTEGSFGSGSLLYCQPVRLYESVAADGTIPTSFASGHEHLEPDQIALHPCW